MRTQGSASGLSIRVRHRAALIAALALPTSLMAAPAIAQEPRPSPVSQQADTATPTSVALAQAKRDNKSIEIESLRSETATFYANPDGKTLRAELHSTPIRVKKPDGWHPLDPTLIKHDGVLKPKSTKGELALSLGGDTVAVTYTDDKGRGTISAPAPLPEPAVEDNTATYKNAYGSGADLVITVTPTGFRHQIVLRQRPSKNLRLRIPVDLPKGFKLGKGSDKTAGVLDSKGKEVADLAAAPVLDATEMREPATGRVSMAKTSVDGDDTLVISPDADFLADPAVTYPVTMAAPFDEWTGTGIAGDTFVSHSYPNSSSNKGLNRIIVGRSNSGTVTWRGYIRFHIPEPLLGGTVENADLRLFNYDTNDCNGNATAGIVARRVTTDWNINSMTWSNQPSVTSSGQVGNKGAYGIDCSQGEGELYYSIENMTQAWMDGAADFGVQLSSASESVPTNWRWYRSSEYGGYDGWPGEPRGPVLFVLYTPKPVEDLEVIRTFPADQDIPPASYEEDKAWADAGNVYPDETSVPVGLGDTAEEVREQVKANNSSVELPLMDASYPEDITDEELVEGIDEPASDPSLPVPTPSPDPTPEPPAKTLNANPYFETDTAPWTVTDGTLERSTDRAHETDGTAAAKLTSPAGVTSTLRSEADIAVRANYLHAVSGWFFPMGADTEIEYGVDWFDSEGALITSATSRQALTRDTWSPIDIEDFPPPNAVKGQLRVVVTGGAADPATVYADELKLLGPEAEEEAPGQEHTIDLPLRTDTWIDNLGSSDSSSDTLWTGTWDGGIQFLERTYLKFDTSALVGKQVTAAELQLWNTESYGCGNSGSGIKVQRITSPWDSGTLGWDHQPTSTDVSEAKAKDPAGCIGQPPSDAQWSWSVTTIAQEWAAGEANYGLLLRGADESASAPVYDRGFASSRATGSQGPTLTVTYIDSTGPTTPPTEDPGEEPDDTTPPTVLEVYPSEVDGFDPDTSITVRFSEPVTGARLTVTDLLMNEQISGSTTMSADSTVLTFTPDDPLTFFYEAEVTSGEDAAGNTMEPYAWYFGLFSPSAKKPAAYAVAAKPEIRAMGVRGAAESGEKTRVVSTIRPTLVVAVEDRLGRPSTVEVEVAPDAGATTRQVWKAKADDVPSGGTARVRVPDGHLKNNRKARWRARAVVSGSVGSWSEWQTFETSTAAESKSVTTASRAEEIKQVLPKKSFTPARVSYNECLSEPRAKTAFEGYAKSRYSVCKFINWTSRHYENKNLKGEVKGRQLIMVNTYHNKREIEVSSHIWVDSRSGTLANKPHKFTHRLEKAVFGDRPVPDPCQHLQSSGMSDRYYTLDEWIAAQGTQWQIVTRYRNLEEQGFNRWSDCNVVALHGFTGKNVKWGAVWPQYVRCDSSSTISWYRNGGCVNKKSMPALTLGRNDTNSKGVLFSEVYDHNKQALTNGGRDTVPQPGGRTFPTLTGVKSIPGGSPKEPLSRALHSVDKRANGARAAATCEIEYKGQDTTGKACDEFPYASTAEGSAFAKPTFNYSVKYITQAQNSAHGDIMTAWYQQNRILRGEEFWVNLR